MCCKYIIQEHSCSFDEILANGIKEESITSFDMVHVLCLKKVYGSVSLYESLRGGAIL